MRSQEVVKEFGLFLRFKTIENLLKIIRRLLFNLFFF